MIQTVDTILALVLLSILFSFGSSRLPGLIKVMAFQGVVVSVVPFFIGHTMSAGGTALPSPPWLIRGIGIPLCIYLAIKKVAIRREVEPIVRIPCLSPGRAGADRGGHLCASHQVRPALDQRVSALLLPTAITLLVAGMFSSWPGATPSPWCWGTS
jgi:hydrogenase-4 component E